HLRNPDSPAPTAGSTTVVTSAPFVAAGGYIRCGFRLAVRSVTVAGIAAVVVVVVVPQLRYAFCNRSFLLSLSRLFNADTPAPTPGPIIVVTSAPFVPAGM
ncbi:unnamed protein product, partial [Ectocarpus sp. 12 AP-2014]